VATINLLPWRQWERERKQKQFLASLAAVVALGAVLVFGAGMFLDSDLEEQNRLNTRLETDIADLDSKISEIAELETEREELLSRMRIIQELQGNRPIIVRVFDEVVRKLSKGVHFESLAGSDWFTRPNLKSIQEDPENLDYGSQASEFELTFVQSNPNKSEDDG